MRDLINTEFGKFEIGIERILMIDGCGAGLHFFVGIAAIVVTVIGVGFMVCMFSH